MDSERIKFLAKIVEALEQIGIKHTVYFGETQEYVKEGKKSDFAIKGRYLSLSELEILQDHTNARNIYCVPGCVSPTQTCSGYTTGNLGWIYYLIEL